MPSNATRLCPPRALERGNAKKFDLEIITEPALGYVVQGVEENP